MHAPANYECPFCRSVKHPDSDVFYQNDHATALIALRGWESNPGHAIVVPNKHYESLYDIPEADLGEVYKVVKKVAIAMKQAYKPDGISTRQHNEPGGEQSVWHLHVHVFPRYEDDRLYQNHEQRLHPTREQRAEWAEKLRAFIR